MPILMEKEEEGMLSPILAHGGVRFMWIKHNNLYRILLRGSSQADSCVGMHVCTCVCPHVHTRATRAAGTGPGPAQWGQLTRPGPARALCCQ